MLNLQRKYVSDTWHDITLLPAWYLLTDFEECLNLVSTIIYMPWVVTVVNGMETVHVTTVRRKNSFNIISMHWFHEQEHTRSNTLLPQNLSFGVVDLWCWPMVFDYLSIIFGLFILTLASQDHNIWKIHLENGHCNKMLQAWNLHWKYRQICFAHSM